MSAVSVVEINDLPVSAFFSAAFFPLLQPKKRARTTMILTHRILLQHIRAPFKKVKNRLDTVSPLL
jgi:hypothetical protein